MINIQFSPGADATVQPPREVSLGDGETLVAFDRNTANFGSRRRHAMIAIQNIGTGIVRYAINSVPTVDTAHGTLAAGLTLGAGDGAMVTFDKNLRIENLNLLAVGRTTVQIMVATRNDVID